MIYGYLVAAIVFAGAITGSYFKGRADGAIIVRSEYVQRDIKAAQDYAAKEKTLQEAYRAKEAEWSQKFVSASRTYQKGIANAANQRLSDLAAIDAGALRLRDPGSIGKACGDKSSETAPGASGNNDSARSGLQAEASGMVLSEQTSKWLIDFAHEADSVVRQLTACQRILIEERG